MPDREPSPNRWIDFIWIVFLGALALLPPIAEIHKQLIILAILVVQLFEGWLIGRMPTALSLSRTGTRRSPCLANCE